MRAEYIKKHEFIENELQNVLKKADSEIELVSYECEMNELDFADFEYCIIHYKNGKRLKADITADSMYGILIDVVKKL